MPLGGAALLDTGKNELYQGEGTVLQDCLEGWLLGNWHSGQPVFDAVFVHQLPAAKADNNSGFVKGHRRTYASSKHSHRSSATQDSLKPAMFALRATPFSYTNLTLPTNREV